MGTRLNRAVFDLKTRVAMRPQRRAYAALQQGERLDPEVLVAQQLSQAMALAQVAFHRTAFYREAFTAAGIEEGDLHDPATFTHLPVLEKDTLRSRVQDLIVHDTRSEDRLPSSTGGSTGEPLTVYNDRLAPTAPMWWRAYQWWGVSPADDTALIYRMKHTPRQELKERLEWWPTRTIKLDARTTTGEDIERFLKQWQRVRPALLNGYVGAVHELAAHVREHGKHLHPPRAIAVTASMLHEAQRADIEESLQAPVYDCYRSAEVPWIAAQCPVRDGLHVMADLRCLEVVDGSGAASGDEVGDVLVTDLTNRVFPILRYRIGDRTRLRAQACSCGRTLPLMDPIDGRVVDVLRTPTGRVLSGGLGTLLNTQAHALRKFQLHQAADFAVTLRYVTVLGSSPATVSRAVEAVVADLDSMLGGEVPIRPEQVEDVHHVGGKVRLVVSEAG